MISIVLILDRDVTVLSSLFLGETGICAVTVTDLRDTITKCLFMFIQSNIYC
jgi:hypothetical protein